MFYMYDNIIYVSIDRPWQGN